MIVLTFLFFLLEIVIGYKSGSNALKADAFHMLSDILSLMVAYIAVYISPQKWSRNTYGFARAEVLGALTNSVFLISLSFTIFMDSITRLFNHELVDQPKLVLYVGIAGFLVNMLGLLLFHDFHHGHSHSHEHNHGHSHGGEGHSHCQNHVFDSEASEQTLETARMCKRGHLHRRGSDGSVDNMDLVIPQRRVHVHHRKRKTPASTCASNKRRSVPILAP